MSRRTDDVEVIHFSFRVPPTQMFQERTGACCTYGRCTSHEGLVTCPECVEIIGSGPKEPSAVE